MRTRQFVSTAASPPSPSSIIKWTRACKHRRIEIPKIRRLHELEKENPTNGYATQNYRDADLQERIEILKQLRRKTDRAVTRSFTSPRSQPQ
jgi:hypothetical protein